MPIITIKHEGTIYQRQIEKYSTGVYIMHSKGNQYWFRKDADVRAHNGWHLVNGGTLPDFLMELICIELENLSKS